MRGSNPNRRTEVKTGSEPNHIKHDETDLQNVSNPSLPCLVILTMRQRGSECTRLPTLHDLRRIKLSYICRARRHNHLKTARSNLLKSALSAVAPRCYRALLKPQLGAAAPRMLIAGLISDMKKWTLSACSLFMNLYQSKRLARK